MPSLVYTDESGDRVTLELATRNGLATVGRNPDCSITTTNPSVSRNHSEIRQHGPYMVIVDKGSSNGTFVNDDEVKKPVVLQGGDLIKCGDFEIEFHDDDGAPRKRPAAAAAAGNGSAPAPAPPTAPPPQPPTHEAPSPVAAERPERAERPDRAERGSRSRRSEASERARAKRVQSSASSPAIDAIVEPDDGGGGVAAAELARKVEELQALVAYYESEANPSEAQAKLGEVENELTRQQAITQTLEEQQEQLQIDLRQQDKLIGELENRLERRDMEIENHLEKQKELCEQLAHQADQIGDLRRDVNERDHEIEELSYKHEESQRSVDEGRKVADERSAEIQEYKAELSQKSRLIEELQKQLDIMTYDLKAANEELADYSETSTAGGAEVAALERKVRHLQEIVTDKEGIIEDLKSRVDEHAEEIGLLREDDTALDSDERDRLEGRLEDLKAEIEELRSAGRGGATTDKLNDLKRANRELRHRVEELEAQATSGPKGAATSDEATAPGAGGSGNARQLKALQADLEELQEENELLRQRVDKMRKGGADPDPDAAAAVTALKRENRELRRRIRELEESGAAGTRAASDDRFVEVIDAVNAAVSTWVTDFDSASFSAAELKRLVEMLDRVDLSGLEARDRRKLESIIRDVEPHETLGNLEDTLNVCLERAKDMKAKLRDAKRRMME